MLVMPMHWMNCHYVVQWYTMVKAYRLHNLFDQYFTVSCSTICCYNVVSTYVVWMNVYGSSMNTMNILVHAHSLTKVNIVLFDKEHILHMFNYLTVVNACTYCVMSWVLTLCVIAIFLFVMQCSFARIVFKLERMNKSFMQKLHSFVIETNIKALGLLELSEHVRYTALTTYTLSV